MNRAVAAIFAALAIGSPAMAQVASLDEEEGSVLAVAIQPRLNGREGWLLIYGETASFRCDSGQKSYVQFADGCSGMRTAQDSIEKVLLRLRSDFPKMSDEVLAEFRSRADRASRVGGPLPLATKQVIWRSEVADPPPEMGSPTLAITVSRVGFNKAHTQALAYVGSTSWSGAERAYGEYIFLSKADAKWLVVGTSRVWDLGK